MIDNYIKITFPGVATEETLLGLLTELPFTGFEEEQDHLIGYMASTDWTEQMKVQIFEVLKPFAINVLVEEVPFENWNHKWEEYYPEVEIDHFCRIYAPFHSGPTQKFKYEIIITPQMAFGTGHHATTEMMIRLMSHLSTKINNCAGLDFGSGSGILAVLAAKMGASHVDAIEIDPYAFQNMEENILLNDVDLVRSFMGGKEMIPVSASYDIILANVTKNVILAHGQDFYDRLRSGGRIIVSGIHNTDLDEVIPTYEKIGFYKIESMNIGKWAAVLFEKQSQEVG